MLKKWMTGAYIALFAMLVIGGSACSSSKPESYVFDPAREVERLERRDAGNRAETGRERVRSVQSPDPATARQDAGDEASAPRRGWSFFLFGGDDSAEEIEAGAVPEAEPQLSRRERREMEREEARLLAESEQMLQEEAADLEAEAQIEQTEEIFDEPVSRLITGYRLQTGDPVQVYLQGIPEPSEYEYVIADDGFLNLPYIEPIQVAGLTASELQRAIHDAYIEQQIYRQITVNVIVPTQSYFVRGEVRQPGRFPLISGMTLLRAIATAGGYTEFARPTRVEVMRADDGDTLFLNARELELNPEEDIEIKARDVITVRRSIF
jgi:polysaccharide biosynthesis/export protein VpsN